MAASRLGRGWRRYRRHLPAYLMVAPTVLLFLVYMAFPLVSVVVTSLLDWNGIVGVRHARWVGFENYLDLARDPVWWTAVENTLLFTAVQLAVEPPLALFLALLLNSARRGMGFFRTVGFLPAVTSAAVIGLAFGFFFSPLGGPANALLVDRLHLLDAPVAFLGERGYAFWTVTGVVVWHVLGIDVVLLLAALQAVDRDLLDAAAVDGANAWRRLWTVTLPAIRPVIAVMLLLSTANSLKVFDYFAVMTGGGPGFSTTTMAIHMFRFTTFGSGMGTVSLPAVGYGSSIAVTLGAIIVGVVVVQWRVFRWFRAAE